MYLKNSNVIGVIATMGVFVGSFFGQLDSILRALLVFIILDYITGVADAFKSKALNSYVGWIGILKKCGILACVILGNVLDSLLLGTEHAPCRTMVIFFYIANEGLSILENIGSLGVPIPEKLKDIIEELKKEG